MELRKSIIHNDANDWNFLAQNGQITGIIDFGDIIYSALINELAVSISYNIFYKDNPLHWASIIVKAYHKKLALQTEEVDILYYLIPVRLCISVIHSAYNRKLNPKNEYISVNEKPAFEILRKWKKINPDEAKKTFRSCIGL